MAGWFQDRAWRQGAIWAAPEAASGNFGEAWKLMNKGVKSGWRQGFGMTRGEWGFTALPAAIIAGMAPRGRKITSFAASMIAWPVASLIGGLTGTGPIGAMATLPAIEKSFNEGLSAFHDFAQNYSGIKMGGWYSNTQAAYTMRQAAVKEMSGSLMNARQFLGKEGMLMHQ